VCRRVCGVLHGAYSACITHRASIWSLSSFAIEACPPFHRPSHCLPRHSKLPVSLLLKHHSRSLQMPVSSVNSELPPVCIHVSHFITQTPPPLHAHHCRPPYISSSPMLFLFFVSRTASLLANRPSNKLIAAGLLVYIYILQHIRFQYLHYCSQTRNCVKNDATTRAVFVSRANPRTQAV
jgi:hypothetical protein